jgi:hypothetical protein
MGALSSELMDQGANEVVTDEFAISYDFKDFLR